MKKLLLKIIVVGLAPLLFSSVTSATSLVQDGLDALGKGDYQNAYRILLSHGEAGDVDAQYNIGVMFEDGLGRATDYQKAAKWLTLAAKQGDSDAQTRLGLLYEKGLGVNADIEEAAKWYRASAQQGNVHGQSNLADYYISKKDYQNAAVWLEKAGRQGHPYARYVLGVMYIKGFGVEKDLVKAKRWIEAAAAVGQPDALRLLKSQEGNFSGHLNVALSSLRNRPGGYVIVENKKTGKFIQFANSKNKKILINIPYQTLDIDENKRASQFFYNRGIDNAAYSSPAYDPVTQKQVGIQRSYESILNLKDSEISELAKAFFLEVYGYEENFPYKIEEG